MYHSICKRQDTRWMCWLSGVGSSEMSSCGIFYYINRNYPCAKFSIWSPDRVRLTALCTYSFTTITRPQILWMGLPFDDTLIHRFSQGKNEYHTRGCVCVCVCVCSRESVAGCQLIDAIEGEETEAEVKICLFPWIWWYTGVKSDDKHAPLEFTTID